MKSNISACSGASCLRWSLYKSPAALKRRSLALINRAWRLVQWEPIVGPELCHAAAAASYPVSTLRCIYVGSYVVRSRGEGGKAVVVGRNRHTASVYTERCRSVAPTTSAFITNQ